MFDKRLLLVSVVIALGLALPPSGPTPLWAQAACTFTLGFKLLRDQIPDVVGDCIENERVEANGDVAQRTTNGLLVWRKGDGYIAFTDGGRTWIQGPNGIEVRPNGQRFPWEALPAATVTGTIQHTPDASARPSGTAAPTRPGPSPSATPAPKPVATAPPAKPPAKPPTPPAPPPKKP